MERTLSHAAARRVYDRIGAKQDTQAFYEDRATEELLAHGDFEHARSVFEFGAGTGRFAAKLLEHRLSDDAIYRGVDVSPVMVELARERLAGFGGRAAVALSDGSPPSGEPDAAYDRFVSNFVFDLLSAGDIDAVLLEAHRMLRPGALLCLASLGRGHGPLSRMVATVWKTLYRVAPPLLGGCRPVDVGGHLAPERWRIRRHTRLAPFGLPAEAIVAERV